MNEDSSYFLFLLEEAILLCDQAIEEGRRTEKPYYVRHGLEAKERFIAMRDNALTRPLPPPTGSGLGITKELGEWAPDYLYSAGKSVEAYYRDRMKCNS